MLFKFKELPVLHLGNGSLCPVLDEHGCIFALIEETEDEKFIIMRKWGPVTERVLFEEYLAYKQLVDERTKVMQLACIVKEAMTS